MLAKVIKLKVFVALSPQQFRRRRQATGQAGGNRLRVFVAMSGGVDSAVAAYLLVKQGYEVTGVYMKNWSEESFGGKFKGACPWRRDVRDARSVCRRLKIPLKIYNFEREYERQVLRYFFNKEKQGLTPNPDVVCNREIKFGLFLKRAQAEGADFIATGHYAKIRIKRIVGRTVYQLIPAKDKNKDQTYFLCLLNQRQLSQTLFPLGDYAKPEVRALANQLKLTVADKEESMGICFVGEVKMTDFLKVRIKEKTGPIITTAGKTIGRHIGLPFYTIGQREGLNLGSGGPYYVVGKLKSKNQLVVARGSHDPALWQKQILLTKINWQSGVSPRLPRHCQVQIRYRQPLQSAFLKRWRQRYFLIFKTPQRAVTPGQFCAVYQRGILLGGAEIIQ